MEVILIKEIKPITSEKDYQGGVVNHGDFLEGYCFQINTKDSQNKNYVWELCAKDKVKKIIKK